MEIIIFIIILIGSVIVNEVAHGYMADRLGDPTARLAGRLTLNPLVHLDFVGSLIVPLITSFMGFTFGWAKPVPYNPYNLKNKRTGELLIALAGPVSNFILATIFSIIIRIMVDTPGYGPYIQIMSYIVLINIVLGIFNLIPVPPLDGSKILFSILPDQYGRARMIMETYGPILVFIVIFFFWQFISPVIPMIFRLMTGV